MEGGVSLHEAAAKGACADDVRPDLNTFITLLAIYYMNACKQSFSVLSCVYASQTEQNGMLIVTKTTLASSTSVICVSASTFRTSRAPSSMPTAIV